MLTVFEASTADGSGRRGPLHGIPFDGDAMHTEKLYADVTPLVPFMPWLVED